MPLIPIDLASLLVFWVSPGAALGLGAGLPPKVCCDVVRTYLCVAGVLGLDLFLGSRVGLNRARRLLQN